MWQLRLSGALFLVGWSMLAVVSAAPASNPPTLPPATVFMPSPDGAPVQCNDTYYGYLPGLVDFCLGTRQWQRGHYRDGLEFLKLAAGWGSKGAQYMLGLIHYNGHQVPVNRALGIAWLQLADQRHDDKQVGMVAQSAIKAASVVERQRGEQLFQTMLAKYGDDVATARAWRQFEHQVRHVAYLRSGGMATTNTRNCIFVAATKAEGRGFGLSEPLQSDEVKIHTKISEQLDDFKTRTMFPRMNASGVCVPMAVFDQGAQHLSKVYFHGWEGRVTVGNLQPLPAASAPTH